MDRDERKVALIQDSRAPFFEPGLQELVNDSVAAGRLSATAVLPEAIREADIALVCVGTPSERNGNLSLEQLDRVIREIADALAERSRPLIVAIRQHRLPGNLRRHCDSGTERPGTQPVDVVFNPEFLREGVAVKDFSEPSLVVVGGSAPAALQAVAGRQDREQRTARARFDSRFEVFIPLR